MRTACVARRPESRWALRISAFASGSTAGYTVTRRGGNVTPITPTLRLLFHFLAGVTREWRQLRLRIGARFIEEWNISATLVASDAGFAFEADARARSRSEDRDSRRGKVKSGAGFSGVQRRSESSSMAG